MNIIFEAHIGAERQLTLPAEVPEGRVKVTIEPIVERWAVTEGAGITREEARRRLLAAGLLSTERMAPEGAVPLSDEEFIRIANLFGSGSMTAQEAVDLDRGPKK